MIDILERFLRQINLRRSPINRTAADYIRSMSGEDADCDSMILISLCYGKQIAVTEARAKEDSASADGFAGSAFSDEILLNDVEQLKHLLPYDVGLAEKDCAWHSPLLTFAQLKALKNMRIRTRESEEKRREKWMQRNQGYLDKREEDVTLLEKDENLISPNKNLWSLTNKDQQEFSWFGGKQTFVKGWNIQPNLVTQTIRRSISNFNF